MHKWAKICISILARIQRIIIMPKKSGVMTFKWVSGDKNPIEIFSIAGLSNIWVISPRAENDC